MDLAQLGWKTEFGRYFEPYANDGCLAGRVAREHKQDYHVYTKLGALRATLSGRLRHEAIDAAELPAVGDWVALRVARDVRSGVILAVLPRSGVFSRKAAGRATREQVIAANIDKVFFVAGLDGDFNVRRLERYVTLALQSGASPIIVLNKSDLCRDVETARSQAESVAVGAPVHVVSAVSPESLTKLRETVGRGVTVAVLGSSGVGKSTLINSLLGEQRMMTGAVRSDDDHGRHTTTHRELIVLPTGGVMIDTPGMRELGMWGDTEQATGSFAEIEALSEQCKFRDCGHNAEPGCAVRAAIRSGALESGRFESYQKLGRELAHNARQNDPAAMKAYQANTKRLHKAVRAWFKQKRRF